MVIRFHAAILDPTSFLLRETRLGLVRIYILGKAPFPPGDDLESSLAAHTRIQGLDKPLAPRLVVQEHHGVVEPAIELLLYRIDTMLGLLDFRVPRQHNQHRVLPRRVHVGLLTRRIKGPVEIVGWARNSPASPVPDGFEEKQTEDHQQPYRDGDEGKALREVNASAEHLLLARADGQATGGNEGANNDSEGEAATCSADGTTER